MVLLMRGVVRQVMRSLWCVGFRITQVCLSCKGSHEN